MIVLCKRSMRISGLVLAILLGLILVSPLVNARSVQSQSSDDFLLLIVPSIIAASGSTDPVLTPLEISDLKYMREEEKLARDVYRTLYTHWNLRIFNNISSSEQGHMDALRSLIVRFGIEDPVTDDSTGSFTNPELLALYHDLTAKGMTSKEAAIEVGKEIEILDISDLKEAISASSNDELNLVYQRLLSGSYKHLTAFNSHSEK